MKAPWWPAPHSCESPPAAVLDSCVNAEVSLKKTLGISGERLTWNPKQPFINGCFNWMSPNLYIENGCFTKQPFINGCFNWMIPNLYIENGCFTKQPFINGCFNWMIPNLYIENGCFTKQPFINGCFNWMIPNLYIENGCFTKHPFINGCLGFPVCIKIKSYESSSCFFLVVVSA